MIFCVRRGHVWFHCGSPRSYKTSLGLATAQDRYYGGGGCAYFVTNEADAPHLSSKLGGGNVVYVKLQEQVILAGSILANRSLVVYDHLRDDQVKLDKLRMIKTLAEDLSVGVLVLVDLPASHGAPDIRPWCWSAQSSRRQAFWDLVSSDSIDYLTTGWRDGVDQWVKIYKSPDMGISRNPHAQRLVIPPHRFARTLFERLLADTE